MMIKTIFNRRSLNLLPKYILSRSYKPSKLDKKTEVFNNLRPKKVDPEGMCYDDVGRSFGSGRDVKQIRKEIIDTLNEFYKKKSIRHLAGFNGIDQNLFSKAFISFRRYCYQSESLPPELHIKFCDIIDNRANIYDLFPFFLDHTRQAFPHLECQEELKKISDLGLPHAWYPEARSMSRKIIFHAGPTNSGKTYHAMQKFLTSESGVYCGPLKLLANEIYRKTLDNNVPCDLITGDERIQYDADKKSSHKSSTIEMVSTSEPVDVAVIDEIQMLRDPGRGWAWTRALLGIPAKEVHLCGEEAALDLVKWMLMETADTIDVIRYQRLTPLEIEDKAIEKLSNVKPGDCIVCFRKQDLFKVRIQLDKLGIAASVIYGSMPPFSKLNQCSSFNDPENSQKVMVATDAIGMGLNLSIKRVIFYSCSKVSTDTHGKKSINRLTTSQCLQIAGRAGRYHLGQDKGYVTTLHASNYPILKEIMSGEIEPILQAGLQPTADQIELFGYHLPHLKLSELIDLFIDLCEFDSKGYFICDMSGFKILADLIQDIQISLRERYVFCCAPINIRERYCSIMFVKMARQFSTSEPVTCEWMCRQIEWPCKIPQSLTQLAHLETLYDVLESYLWLSYRFPDKFTDGDAVREVQTQIDSMIHERVSSIVELVKKQNEETDSFSSLSFPARKFKKLVDCNDRQKLGIKHYLKG